MGMTVRAEDVIAEAPTLAQGGERLAPGARAGDYEIEGFLGAGAMGDVYAARHPLIGKRAAVKVIKRRLAAAPEMIERFLREARAVNQVGHERVVDVFAVGRLDDGRLYLVMDLLEGESLAARLRKGPLPPEEALAILEAVAAALDAAHGKGVVHRDLKPDNIFLADRGVFVLDFGIAKLLATDAATAPGTLTDQGTWLGTPAYMAPEQWGADGASPASDRYALAAIAFELVAGRPPFAAPTLPGMMEQHFRAPVPRLGGAIDGVLARGLAKDPAARYPSAAAFVAAVRATIGTAGRRRAPWLLTAALGAAVAVGSALVLGLGAGKPAARPAEPRPAQRGPTLEVTSTPPGARVRVDGIDRGATPLALAIDDLAPGAHRVVVARPGYAPIARTIDTAAPAPIRVTLSPVTGFEGVWALPDGALRAFERRGERVAMSSMTDGAAPRTFERWFDFVDADAGTVRFVATEDHVDARAPEEPSCHVDLAAEYTYDLDDDRLERRMERIQLDYADGRCAQRAREWGPVVALRRLATAEDGWVESTAGAGPPALVPQVPFPADDQNAAPPMKKQAPAKQAPQQQQRK